jgi:hypothetical protein
MGSNFRRNEFVKRPRGTPCPALVWFLIRSASDKDEWPFELLRAIARSPTPFRLKNPDLKQALERLGLEWLRPSQISRIRECPAPSRKVPRREALRYRVDRWLRRYGREDSQPLVQSPRCQKLFWAWRGDQKTCDDHLEYAAMFRVQKHRKGKQKKRDNLQQLKKARLHLKRVRRADKRAKRFAQAAPVRPVTPSQLQAQNDRADFRLLRLIRLRYEVEAGDSDRLEAMIKDGYVVPDETEPNTYKPSRLGLRRLAELRTRVGRGPALA